MPTQINFTPSDGNYRFNQTLTTASESATYTFDVRWNTRDNAWRFDMYDPDGNLMVAGVKIVIDTPLGRRSSHPFFDHNAIYAIDTSLDRLDPGFDDIGSRVIVCHFTESDLATAFYGV